jgi:hypothetical protein
MTGALILQLIGGAGFLLGIGALLQFFNTRKSTKDKGSADAYQAYRMFIAGATEDRDREHGRVVGDRDRLVGVRDLLIDLVQDLINLCRKLGATPDQLERFQSRLDDVRSM